jgi:hypothetical protein
MWKMLKSAYRKTVEFFQKKTQQMLVLKEKVLEGEYIPAGSMVVGGAVGVGFAGNALAAAPDFSSLTAAVDYSTAISAILLVAAGIAGVAIVVYGIKLIIPMIRGGR